MRAFIGTTRQAHNSIAGRLTEKSGLIGLIVPFIGIKLIDVILTHCTPTDTTHHLLWRALSCCYSISDAR